MAWKVMRSLGEENIAGDPGKRAKSVDALRAYIGGFCDIIADEKEDDAVVAAFARLCPILYVLRKKRCVRREHPQSICAAGPEETGPWGPEPTNTANHPHEVMGRGKAVTELFVSALSCPTLRLSRRDACRRGRP